MAEKVAREGGRVEVLDVSIKVFNHADGELHDLVVGLSVGSVL